MSSVKCHRLKLLGQFPGINTLYVSYELRQLEPEIAREPINVELYVYAVYEPTAERNCWRESILASVSGSQFSSARRRGR